LPKVARDEGTVANVETAKLELRFDTLVLPDGTRVPIVASMKSEAESTKKKDTATIAGSAVGGAILGALIGKDAKGAAIGAIAGGAIGTGVVLGTKGNEVEIPPGTEFTIEMDEAVSVPAPPASAS
jgi:outer membrane lipoprotein SlyB